MRHVHRAGEKAFVDYSGVKLSYFGRELDERVEVELFVAVLGAGNYTYAEATHTQKIADFCASTAPTSRSLISCSNATRLGRALPA